MRPLSALPGALILVLLIGCGGKSVVATPASRPPASIGMVPSSTSSPIPQDWVTHSDPQNHFAISVPPGWQSLPSGSKYVFASTDPATGLGISIDLGPPAEASNSGAIRLAASDLNGSDANFLKPKLIMLEAGPAALSLARPTMIGKVKIHVLKYFIPSVPHSFVVSFVGGESSKPEDIPPIVATFRIL
jgi:hypothetical protein